MSRFPETEALSLRESLEKAITYLVSTQHPLGSWTDFWLPVGTSNAWVTAYVGLALSAAANCSLLHRTTRSTAATSALRAAGWLLQERPRRSGWGYNATVPPDADSTAHALSLLARLGIASPGEAVSLLREHEVPGEGFRTYNWQDPAYQWTQACADVTASAIRALHDVGEMNQEDLQRAWQEMLGARQDEHGWWTGYWWTTPNYTTGLVLEVWHAAGCPPLPRSFDQNLPTVYAFDLAWKLHAQCFAGDASDCAARAAQLIAMQETDGAWPGAPVLRVPPSHKLAGSAYRTIIAREARRLFTTASAVRAIAFACEQIVSPQASTEPLLVATAPGQEGRHKNEHREESAVRSIQGKLLDDLVYQAARASSFDVRRAAEMRDIFATLTEESLAAPCPWPAVQLSGLAGGMPLEFSTTVGWHIKPSLRYAAEVGNPFLAPYNRARSGIAAVARTAHLLGYFDAWRRVSPSIELLVSPNMLVPDGLRFWVWSGIDHVATGGEGSRPTPLLKLYFNLLNREVGDAQKRVVSALRAASIPVSDELNELLETLGEAGFLHEMGFGLGPGGKIACKIYYELYGWRRSLVHRILQQVGLPCDTDAVCPEIPGLLLESLASKSRAGIALRIDPTSGAVRELTTAAAFLPPMLPHAETRRRVEAWINAHSWHSDCYRSMSGLLLSTWQANPGVSGNLHSLFTRTISSEANWTAIYLRPCLQTPDGRA